MTAPFDPGLQPERTELAWRRTALATGVASLVALRLLPVSFHSAWWALGGVAGVLFSVAIWAHGTRRLRSVNETLAREGNRGMLPGAGPLAALTAVVLAIGVTAVNVVLVV